MNIEATIIVYYKIFRHGTLKRIIHSPQRGAAWGGMGRRGAAGRAEGGGKWEEGAHSN